ncbi:MAG TPA: site-2 protease family protein [Polyangia bacterium]|nr:site-2 protease family protein [Polyangia bacterium]
MSDPDTLLKLRDAAVYLIALILSICVHEFGHAFVADKLGDPLPRAQGRVTLNPIAHIDPIGTLLFPLVGFFMASGGMIGWGKPVQISLSARAITRKVSIKTAHLLVALAGPMMNVLFMFVLSGVFFAMLKFAGGSSAERLLNPLAFMIRLNVLLACFNLIPCPPLDGGAVLRGILPRNLEYISDYLDKYGFALFFLLLFTGALSFVLRPAMAAAMWWIGTLMGWAS